MGVSADVKPLATDDAKIDFRQADRLDFVRVNMDEPRFALDHFSLAGQLVERDAVLLDRAHHRRHLVKIAVELRERGVDLFAGQLRDRPGFGHHAVGILAAGGFPELEGSRVFLVLAHQQVLDLGAPADRDEKQPGGQRIERAAMADLLRVEGAPRDRDDVVRCHPGRLVHHQYPVNLVS